MNWQRKQKQIKGLVVGKMAKFKKKGNKLKKSEETYLSCVIRNILNFGFTKKDIKAILKKL